tara:strand:+ start:5221 stop:5985 length:765 start_codon:yes stop_codon:yes gene_type:complete
MVRDVNFFKVIAKAREGNAADHHYALHRPAGKFLRHAVFGMNDGLVSTLALVAGLVGAYMQRNVIIIAGLAEMFAGAISMSLGTYISTKSQIEYYKREITREKKELERLPKLEKEHVRRIYKEKGFSGRELDRIVEKLTSNKQVWLDVLVSEELGLSRSKIENAFVAGIVMFFAFLFGAFIPISPYLFVPIEFALKTAIVASLGVMFLAGAGKTYFTGRNWFRSGIEMVCVGAIATFVAFYVGQFISQFVKYIV